MIHIHDPGRRRPAPVVNLPIRLSTEHQARFGLARAFDAGPLILRIDLAQIQQDVVDGMGVDIEKACAGGPMSVDGRDSDSYLKREMGKHNNYGCIIQDLHAQ